MGGHGKGSPCELQRRSSPWECRLPKIVTLAQRACGVDDSDFRRHALPSPLPVHGTHLGALSQMTRISSTGAGGMGKVEAETTAMSRNLRSACKLIR